MPEPKSPKRVFQPPRGDQAEDPEPVEGAGGENAVFASDLLEPPGVDEPEEPTDPRPEPEPIGDLLKPEPIDLHAGDVRAQQAREHLIDKLLSLDIDPDALGDFCRAVISVNQLPHNAAEQARACNARIRDAVDELLAQGARTYTVMLALRNEDRRLAEQEDDARRRRHREEAQEEARKQQRADQAREREDKNAADGAACIPSNTEEEGAEVQPADRGVAGQIRDGKKQPSRDDPGAGSRT